MSIALFLSIRDHEFNFGGPFHNESTEGSHYIKEKINFYNLFKDTNTSSNNNNKLLILFFHTVTQKFYRIFIVAEIFHMTLENN